MIVVVVVCSCGPATTVDSENTGGGAYDEGQHGFVTVKLSTVSCPYRRKAHSGGRTEYYWYHLKQHGDTMKPYDVNGYCFAARGKCHCYIHICTKFRAGCGM